LLIKEHGNIYNCKYCTYNYDSRSFEKEVQLAICFVSKQYVTERSNIRINSYDCSMGFPTPGLAVGKGLATVSPQLVGAAADNSAGFCFQLATTASATTGATLNLDDVLDPCIFLRRRLLQSQRHRLRPVPCSRSVHGWDGGGRRRALLCAHLRHA
jgi:energy-converting hydrogenase Eha subunit A